LQRDRMSQQITLPDAGHILYFYKSSGRGCLKN
jgi:hypothetical protein